MDAQPIDYVSQPIRSRGTAGWLASRFSRRHGRIAIAIWLGFSGLTLWIVLRGLDDDPGRVRRAALTTAATVLGPMTGAVSRHFQDCCLAFSLSLLPWCLAALAAAVATQLVVPPTGRWARAARLVAWTIGLLAWFGGGIVSFMHALS